MSFEAAIRKTPLCERSCLFLLLGVAPQRQPAPPYNKGRGRITTSALAHLYSTGFTPQVVTEPALFTLLPLTYVSEGAWTSPDVCG